MIRTPVEHMDGHGHVSVVEPHWLRLLKRHQSVKSLPCGGFVRSAHCQKHLKVAKCRKKKPDRVQNQKR